MNKNFLVLSLLFYSLVTQAIFEDCHDRIIKYKVLALVTGGTLQKDMVLSFDYQGTEDDTHAVIQECEKNGYELVETKHIKLLTAP